MPNCYPILKKRLLDGQLDEILFILFCVSLLLLLTLFVGG